MTSLAAGPEIVAIPGPSVVPQRVLAAMHRPMPDIYDGELLSVTDEVFDALPAIAGTSQRALVAVGNGHAAWEMALSNTLSRGDKVLVLDCGRFAEIWGEMAQFNGLRVELVRAEPGRANDADEFEARLRADREHQIAAVLIAHVDTASSVRNDVPAFRRALDAADHPALLMVDGIASIGCEPFHMDDWGVDLVVSASQKGLMTPPGLAIVWPGPRARKAHELAGLRTRYWDWSYRTEDGPHYLRFCGTPPVSHLFGLREALLMIDEEGLEARWARHRALGSAVRAAIGAWSEGGQIGFYVTEPGERANSVTNVQCGSIDAAEVSRRCRETMGVTLGAGIGDLGGASFRIGHMGHVNAPMVLGVVGAIEAVLTSMGADLPRSGVAATAAALGEAPVSDNNPPTDSYAADVYRAYLGEVYGEAMYTTIAMAQTDARRRAAWLTMVDLEVAMRERLVSTVERLDGDPSSSESSGELDRWRAAGRAEGVDYTRMPWREMIARFERELGDDIERYRALERGCPVTDAEMLSMLTEHEVVAQEFARCELSGATSTSLDPVRQLIVRLRSSPASSR